MTPSKWATGTEGTYERGTYRTFGGKRYRKSDVPWPTKQAAQRHAKHLRGMGYKVRVTQVPGTTKWTTWAK